MKTAVVFSIPATTSPGFAWRWRSANQKEESALSFVFYADCLDDAKRNGYTVERLHARGLSAPIRGYGERLA